MLIIIGVIAVVLLLVLVMSLGLKSFNREREELRSQAEHFLALHPSASLIFIENGQEIIKVESVDNAMPVYYIDDNKVVVCVLPGDREFEISYTKEYTSRLLTMKRAYRTEAEKSLRFSIEANKKYSITYNRVNKEFLLNELIND